MVDLMRAATWKEGEDAFDLNTTIESVREVLEEKSFSEVPKAHILRSLAACAGLGIYRESIDDLRAKTGRELKSSAGAAVEGYRKAVDFLTSELGLPSYAYVPCAHQLTLLVEFFHRYPQPSHSQREELKRWFWRTSFSGYFQLFNTGDQRRDLEILRVFAAGETKTLEIGKRIDYVAFPYRGFSLNTAMSKIFGLLLVSSSPRSLLNGSRVNTWAALSIVNRNEFHHIFPKAFLQSSGVDSKKSQFLANICLLSKGDNRNIWDERPSVYFKRIEKNLGNSFHDVIRRNLISKEAYIACLDEDYIAFLKERSKTIVDRMYELVDEREIRGGRGGNA